MAYSCIVVLRFVTRYSDTKIGIWRFLYRHDDLLKKKDFRFFGNTRHKIGQKIAKNRTKSPKIGKKCQKSACRFLAIFTCLTCVIYVYIYISMFLEASNKNLLEVVLELEIWKSKGASNFQCTSLKTCIICFPYP